MLPTRGLVQSMALAPMQRRPLVCLARKSSLLSPVCSGHRLYSPLGIPRDYSEESLSRKSSTTRKHPTSDGGKNLLWRESQADIQELQTKLRKLQRKNRWLKYSGHKTEIKDMNAWSVNLVTTNNGPSSSIIITHEEIPNPIYLQTDWLRDACPCNACVDPSSGQKRFSTADVPLRPEVESVIRSEDGSLEVKWTDDFYTHDTHVSRFPPSFCAQVITKVTGHPVLNPYVMWDRARLENDQPFGDYESFMEEKASFASALQFLAVYGLFILRDVPTSEDMVERIASKIGTIQNSFYGMTWDVVSKPNAENVAYTDSYLGLHQDLLYMRNIPRIQVLHCIKNSCDGGESIFRDGRQVVIQLLKMPNLDKGLLYKRDIMYEYNKNGHCYRKGHPLIQGLYPLWSPPFQASMQPIDPLEKNSNKKWHECLKTFKEVVETEAGIYEYKLKEGDCVLFDNHRLFHGRRKFDTSSGERWLRGAYIDNDSWLSTLRSLEGADGRPYNSQP
ncbi:hypothetical protein F4810DRAFT_695634 [Camillea tinctor]|nr:hypothetical protein F4810DRAFT_695634 [Camillea tinctor]